VLCALGIVYAIHTRHPLAWLLWSLLALLGTLFIAYAYRFSRVRLTPSGIEDGTLNPPMLWGTIAEARYNPEYSTLYLRDQLGRRMRLPLAFALSSGPVLSAIREHLPAHVTITLS
jgi:hypothetical protein